MNTSKKIIALIMAICMILGMAACGDSSKKDQEAADKVAALIDAIYVQERTDKTDDQCAEAKKAWDALTDAQKELV
ncbi:MAG: cobalt chelatase, partial [Firmicutes bacterium]|nr:cobalt chelatase [Bacillota bacterium]